MSGDMAGIATETIPFNAHVLCRGFRVSLAGSELANGISKTRPLYRGGKLQYEEGEHVRVTPIQGLGGRSLQALADAPIMDPANIYLPAGRVSMAEARAREAANLERLP